MRTPTWILGAAWLASSVAQAQAPTVPDAELTVEADAAELALQDYRVSLALREDMSLLRVTYLPTGRTIETPVTSVDPRTLALVAVSLMEEVGSAPPLTAELGQPGLSSAPPLANEAPPDEPLLAPTVYATPLGAYVSFGLVGMLQYTLLQQTSPAVLARAGGGWQLHELVRIGGSLEGGAHGEFSSDWQPMFRPCAEATLTVPMGSPRFVALFGAEACLSLSRHLVVQTFFMVTPPEGGVDHDFQVGAAGGGYLGASFAIDDSLALIARFDIDAWRTDGIQDGSSFSESEAWRGTFAGSAMLEIH